MSERECNMHIRSTQETKKGQTINIHVYMYMYVHVYTYKYSYTRIQHIQHFTFIPAFLSVSLENLLHLHSLSETEGQEFPTSVHQVSTHTQSIHTVYMYMYIYLLYVCIITQLHNCSNMLHDAKMYISRYSSDPSN